MSEGRVPFSNGTEVDMFRANRCDRCSHDDPEGGGCDDFAFGVMNGEWPDLLVEVERGAANPLGVECSRFAVKPGPPEPLGVPVVRSRVVIHPAALGSYDE